MSHLVK